LVLVGVVAHFFVFNLALISIFQFFLCASAPLCFAYFFWFRSFVL
jgi:hypothetical protein